MEQDDKQKEYADDRVPILDPPEVEPGFERTADTPRQHAQRLEELEELEEGIMGENKLLEDSVITDNDLAEENLENDNP